MSDPQKAQAAAQEQTLELGLLDQIVEQGRVGTDTASKERGKSLVKEFVQQVLQGQMTISRDTEAMINARLKEIMVKSFTDVLEASLKHKVDMRTAAYMLAVGRVAEATLTRGIYP